MACSRTCDSFIYFGLSLYSTQLAGNIYTNYLAMGIIELPAYIITPITLEKSVYSVQKEGLLF